MPVNLSGAKVDSITSFLGIYDIQSTFKWSGNADDVNTVTAADSWYHLPDRSSNLQRQEDWYDREVISV